MSNTSNTSSKYNISEKYSYVNLNNTNNELSLLEQLSKLDIWEIAVDFKNKKLYHKINLPSMNFDNIKEDIKAKKEKKEKINISNYLDGAYIKEYNIIDTKEIDKYDMYNYYDFDEQIMQKILKQTHNSFILEDPQTKEYIWMFPGAFVNKWNNEFCIHYYTVNSDISRKPFYFKDIVREDGETKKALNVFTEDDKKVWLDKHYTVYSYSIDRVILWSISFAVIYTYKEDKYIKVIYNKEEAPKTYNISHIIEDKGVDIIQIQGAWYIQNIVPYISIAVDDNSDNVSTTWLQSNNLFLYVLPEEVKVIENVVDYIALGDEVYTISMIQWQYYLYKDWLYLRNFSAYYGFKKLDDYIELYTKSHNSDDDIIDVFKLWQYGKVEFLRQEKKQFDLYKLSMKIK